MFLRIATIVVIALLSTTAMAYPHRILIIGDSLTSTGESWPNYINGNVHCLCQGGRAIKTYDVPRDLRVVLHEVTLYSLGTNDIWQWDYFATEATLNDHFSTLVNRGMRVVVVLPPNSSSLQPAIGKVRTVIARTAKKHKLPIIDPSRVWDEALLADDGIHPTAALSDIVGQYIQSQLDTILYFAQQQ